MTRSDLIQRLVLNSISDDLENVDQVILSDGAESAARCGLTIQRSDVVDALTALVRRGLAKAYVLCPTAGDPCAGEVEGMPPLKVPEEDFRTYFYITAAGVALHQVDDADWPFDPDGALVPGWQPPRD